MSISPTKLRTVRLHRPRPISFRYRPRTAIFLLILAALTLLLAWLSLINGNNPLGISDIWDTIRGQADPSTVRSITQWRLPRIIFAILAGAALATSGAVFQSITRNPLGSPDIIGFSTGAYTGALVVAWFGITSIYATPLAALIGGLGTGAVVYLLSRHRGTSGMMLIIVGIGVSMFLNAINTYILANLKLEEALVAASWGAGSLTNITWSKVAVLTITTLVTVPLLATQSPAMTTLKMGDDIAHAVGVNPERTRIILILGAITLVAAVTAFAGPITFVALAAPQLAKQVTRSANVQIIPAAFMGAFLLLASDLIARTVIAPQQLPTGLVTLTLGGAYLVWLLTGAGLRKKHD